MKTGRHTLRSGQLETGTRLRNGWIKSTKSTAKITCVYIRISSSGNRSLFDQVEDVRRPIE